MRVCMYIPKNAGNYIYIYIGLMIVMNNSNASYITKK